MRHFSLGFAAVFLLSSLLLAQHSSSSSGSSSSGGGGSHSSSSGGTASSGSSGGGHSYGAGSSAGSHSSVGGGHSAAVGGHTSSGSSHSSNSGASATRNSSIHGTSVRVSNSFANAHSEQKEIRTGAIHGVREPDAGSHARPALPEKRGFFSFLRHPFRHSERKDPAPDLRRRLCFTGPCQVCANGMVAGKGGCSGIVSSHRTYNVCAPTEIWRGGACVAQLRILDDCNGYRLMMERQAQRVQAAESMREMACSSVNAQECSNATASWQSEMDMYRSLQAQYRQCTLKSRGTYPFAQFSHEFPASLRMDGIAMDWSSTQQIW